MQSILQMGEIAWEEFNKGRFVIFHEFAKQTVGGNGRGLHDEIHHNSVKVWFLNVRQSICEL